MGKVFSGIQPSGQLHLGNYLGAVKKWVELADEHDCVYCIVDYHAITQNYEPKEMQERIFEMAAGLIACGLDTDKCSLFVQSHVPEHTELSWMLNSVTPMGELERQVQFKSKSQHQPENINVGLFGYPVLQAADILLYRADLVPVGEDQVQHLELSREIVRKFSNRFGYDFPEPKPLLSEIKRLKGLDGDEKMSKSLGNTIAIDDDAETITDKLRKAMTNPSRKRRKDSGDPEKCNLYTLHGFFSDEETQDWAAEGCMSADIGCVECKDKLAEAMVSHLAPIQERLAELRENPDEVWTALAKGAQTCRRSAAATLDDVRRALGLRVIKGLCWLPALALLACSTPAKDESPVGVVRQLIKAVRMQDQAAVLALLGPRTRTRLRDAAIKTASANGGKRRYKASEMLSPGFRRPSKPGDWKAKEVTLLSKTKNSARVQVQGKGPDERQTVQLVRVDGKWRVEFDRPSWP